MRIGVPVAGFGIDNKVTFRDPDPETKILVILFSINNINYFGAETLLIFLLIYLNILFCIPILN